MTSPPPNPWEPQLDALGEFIRAQRRHANLSLRELAALTQLSNAYLSQVERGQHEPSVRVLRSLASALDTSVETLLAQAGLFDDGDGAEESGTNATEAAIRADPRLSEQQRDALIAVYRTLIAER
jgi:transcriptional regulator with XRE-family HTH domain